MKTLSVVYVIGLTYFLTAKEPIEFLRSEPGLAPLTGGLESVAHLTSFTLLALLALTARWPIPRAVLYGCLAAYALGTELLQGLLPWRSAEVADFLQDVAGILAGAVLWHLARHLGRPATPARRENRNTSRARGAEGEDCSE